MLELLKFNLALHLMLSSKI